MVPWYTMKSLNQNAVRKVSKALKGKRLDKFENSVHAINGALARGGWENRESSRANSGFYAGLVPGLRFEIDYRASDVELQKEASILAHTLTFGVPCDLSKSSIRRAYQLLLNQLHLKATLEQVEAWVEICREKKRALSLLRSARPQPSITKIGISPKVTRTLTEMNLNLDISSIRMARIEKKVVKTDKGEVFIYRVNWSPGTVHGKSRFISGCQACGKLIPSGRYVPLEAFDQESGRIISLWVGCDCAKNIFGVRDVGVERNSK